MVTAEAALNGAHETEPAIEAAAPPVAAEDEGGYWASVQAEARAARMLPKFWGLTRSAGILNPSLIKERYEAHQAALEGFTGLTNYRPWIFAIAFCIVLTFFGLYMYFDTQDEISQVRRWTWMHVAMCTGFGLGIGAMAGTYSRLRRWWNVAYGDAMGLEKHDPVDPWRVTHVAEATLVRTGFIDEDEDYYFGSSKDAGVDKGMMIFDVPKTKPPLRSMHLKDVWGMPAGLGRVTGISGKATKGMVDSAEELATEKRNMGDGWKRHMKETAFYVLLGVIALLVFLQANSGGQLVDAGAIADSAQQTVQDAR